MALSDQEKELLREAICSGAFSAMAFDQHGRPSRQPVTAGLLKTVAEKSEDDIRIMLQAFKINKVANLTSQVANVTEQLAKMQETLEALRGDGEE